MQFVDVWSYYVKYGTSPLMEVTFFDFQGLWFHWFPCGTVTVSDDMFTLTTDFGYLVAYQERIPLDESAVLAEQHRIFRAAEAARESLGEHHG